MPNIKSAKKRVITSAKKSVNNNNFKSSMRTAIKKVEKDVVANDGATAKEDLNIAMKRIDKAVSSKLVHKNKASRLKSKLTKSVNELN